MWVMPLSKAVISAMCWPILTWVMMLPRNEAKSPGV